MIFYAPLPPQHTHARARVSASFLQDEISSGCPNATTGDCPFNPITVFAPTNTAFQRLAASLNVSVAEMLEMPEVSHGG